VKPDSDERYAIQEIETKVGLLGGWVRFWFRGELVQLPDALLDQRDEARREVAELRSELADKDAEIARLLAQLKQIRGE
jgi:hypothetical protein